MYNHFPSKDGIMCKAALQMLSIEVGDSWNSSKGWGKLVLQSTKFGP